MRKAIITGSFDPPTSGHEDLMKRASALFDEVYVVILHNSEKGSGIFSPEERIFLVEKIISSLALSNLHAAVFSGLASDAANMYGAKYIVRGVRCASDFDYEYNIANIMKRFDAELETVFLPTSPSLSAVSSTYVRELLKYAHPLGDAVPESCRDDMREMYEKKNK